MTEVYFATQVGKDDPHADIQKTQTDGSAKSQSTAITHQQLLPISPDPALWISPKLIGMPMKHS